MITKLVKHGKSLALVIEPEMLNLLKIDADTPLSIETDGKSLIVRRVEDVERQEKFRAALNEVNRKYGKMLKRLA